MADSEARSRSGSRGRDEDRSKVTGAPGLLEDGYWDAWIAERLKKIPGEVAPAERDLQPWTGLWRWDTPSCVKAVEFYKFWGTMTDAEAEQCATSVKEFQHKDVSEGHLEIGFKAADTTRNADFSYTLKIDGRPHDIDPFLRARANNSIKMNPTGLWAHWWEGDALIMEQPCVVRDTVMIHRLTRVLETKDALRCHELITVRETGEVLLTATHAYARVVSD